MQTSEQLSLNQQLAELETQATLERIKTLRFNRKIDTIKIVLSAILTALFAYVVINYDLFELLNIIFS